MPETTELTDAPRKRRTLDPERAAAMGRVSSPAKTRAVTENALLSPRNRGMQQSGETKAKISAGLVGNTNGLNKRKSPDVIARITASNRATAERKRQEKAAAQ